MVKFDDMDTAELVALKDELHTSIDNADYAQDATLGHDLRCCLDQVVAEIEVRNVRRAEA